MFALPYINPALTFKITGTSSVNSTGLADILKHPIVSTRVWIFPSFELGGGGGGKMCMKVW